MFGNNDKRMEQEEKLIENWAWLTEGIDNYETRVNTSMVLENSYGHMVNEGMISEGWLESLLNEDEMLNEAPNQSTKVGDNLIPKVLFPVIRRVMPKLIANELVSVQPIQQRTGVIYHMLYQFSDDKGDVKGGSEYSANPMVGYGDYDINENPFAPGKLSNQGFAKYYSSEKIGPATATLSVSDTDEVTIDSVEIYGAKEFLGMDETKFRLKRVEVLHKESGRYIPINLGANASYDAATGEVSFQGVDEVFSPAKLREAFGIDGGTAFTHSLKVWLVYNQEATSKIPEMEFAIGSQTVDTTQRKLKVRWTKEAEQDMNAFHKIDVEAELVKMASMQMNYEVDRELLTYISDITPASLRAGHDWNGSTEDGSGQMSEVRGNYLDRHRYLTNTIYLLGAKMAQFNRQGPASWAVVSPQMGAILSQLPNFKGEISGGTFNIFEAGQLGNGLKVYIDPNKMENEEIQLGYKSTQTAYGAGVVYSPYVNWMSEKVTNPDNFNNVRGFFSRYAITEVERGRYFYGKVNVTGLDQFFV